MFNISKIGIFIMASSITVSYGNFIHNINKNYTKHPQYIFFWINTQIARFKILTTRLYNTNSIIKSITDYIVTSYENIESYIVNKKYEPDYSIWIMKGKLYENININTLPRSHNDNTHYSTIFTDLTKYKEFSKNENLSWNLIEDYESLDDFKMARDVDIYKKLLKRNYLDGCSNMKILDNKDNFIIMKYNDDTHLVNIYKPIVEPDKLELQLELKRSNMYFISIEYKHPKMKYSLVLTIPSSYYTINNELFSAGFILRCLEYQNSSFYFDNEYELFLMSSNIQMDTIKYGQYIQMNEDDYTVMNLQ